MDNAILFWWDKYTPVTQNELGWDDSLIDEAQFDGYTDLCEWLLLCRNMEIKFLYNGLLYEITTLKLESTHIERQGTITYRNIDNADYFDCWHLCQFKIDPHWNGKYLKDKFDTNQAERYIGFGSTDAEFVKNAQIDGIALKQVLQHAYIVNIG